MKSKLYFAAPFFSQAERLFNEGVAAELEEYFEVYLPQKHGELLLETVVRGTSFEEAKRVVYEEQVAEIRTSDVILVVLDGRSIDEGVALALGFACASDKRRVGLQTDVRRMLRVGNNPMVDGCLEIVFRDVETLLEWAGGERQTPCCDR